MTRMTITRVRHIPTGQLLTEAAYEDAYEDLSIDDDLDLDTATHTTYNFTFVELEVEIEGYYRSSPGNWSGNPDTWTPEETEVEISRSTITLDGVDVSALVTLTDDEQEHAIELIVRGREVDHDDGADYDYDDFDDARDCYY